MRIPRNIFLMFVTNLVLVSPINPQVKNQGAIGSVTIDGKVWNQIAMRPIIPIGNWGVALDLVFYFDAEGNIHSDEWDFSSGNAIKNTIIDKNQKLPYPLHPNKYYSFKEPLKINNLGHFGNNFDLKKLNTLKLQVSPLP